MLIPNMSILLLLLTVPGRVRVAVRLRPRNADESVADADFADCVELQPEVCITSPVPYKLTEFRVLFIFITDSSNPYFFCVSLKG